MSVKMKPTNVIKAHLGLEPNGRVEKFFTSECAKAMDKYVPFDEGNLADYRIDGNLIIYEQPYARYQYYGLSKNGNPLNYQTDKHPLATSYWDKKMVTADLPDIVKRIQDKFGGK